MFAKKLTVLLTVAVVSLGLLFASGMQTAEAKRIGGGFNLGQQKQSFTRQATAPNTAPNTASTTATRTATPTTGGASRWFGPLAGLAAGGLLAALFFGGAFDGLKPMDLIIIALLAYGAYLLIRTLRKSTHAAVSPYARATAGGMSDQSTHTGNGSFPFSGSAPAPLPNVPSWFNEDTFVQGAKQHFTNLQSAWDANDLKTMQEYFTPELFLELARERARIGDENNVTEVQSLNAQLLDLSREGDSVVASVLFQGMVRENYGQPEPIAEIWHVRHVADTAQGDWLIAGIQQYNHTIH